MNVHPNFHNLYDQLRNALQAHTDHSSVAANLQASCRGLLVFFHPPDSAGAPAPDWLPTALDMAAAHHLFRENDIAVIGVVPPTEDPDFAKKYTIPYPLVRFSDAGDLPCLLWKLATGAQDCAYTRQAVFLRDRPDEPDDPPEKKSQNPGYHRMTWTDYAPAALEGLVLGELAEKHLLPFSPSPDYVHLYERGHLAQRRNAAFRDGQGLAAQAGAEEEKAYKNLMADGDRPAVGLAFSGGGIRAATFNLGITQALARHRALPWVDYLSSVSGGGFTASALVSLLSRRPRSGPYHFNTQWERFPFNPDIEAFRPDINLDVNPELKENRNYMDVSHRPGPNNQLRYLVKKGNYLVPRLGLATRELLRGVGTLLTGTGYTLMLFVIAIFGLACLHYFATSLVVPAILQDLDTTRLAPAAAPDDGSLTWSVEIDGEAATIAVPLNGEPDPATDGPTETYSLAYLLFGSYATDPPTLEPPPPSEEKGTIPWGVYLAAAAGGLVAGLLIYRFLVGTYSYPESGGQTEETEDGEGSGEPDAVYPQPRKLAFVLWLALLITIGGMAWTWFGAGNPPDLRTLAYPAAIGIAALIAWPLLRGVPDTGVIDRPRWLIWLLALVLSAFGVVLFLPGAQGMFGRVNAWTWLPLLAVFFLLLLIGVYRESSPRWGAQGMDRWERYDRFVLRSALLTLLGFLALTIALAREFAGPALGGQIFWLWQPAVFLAGTFASLNLIRLIVIGKRTTWGSLRFRTMIWAMIGMTFYAVIVAVLFGLLAVPHILAVGGEDPASPAVPLATAIISGAWAAFLAQFAGKDMGGESILKKLFALPGGIRNAALGLFVVVLWLSLIFFFETHLDGLITAPVQALGLAVLAMGLFIILGSLISYNYLSPHYFFGDRAAEVFLKTDVEVADGRVATVRDETKYRLAEISHLKGSAPYHIVTAAVNLAGSGHLQDRDRKSRHFVFTREFVGSTATGYALTRHYRGGKTNYSSTIALSGAAASPGLGTFTFFAQSFMMALLNIRLGQWWVNPREYRGLGPAANTAAFKARINERARFEDRAFWPLYLADEALAKTSERRRLVNITDGGHTRDNGGLYPLFERRCKLIIGGDASQDEKGLCQDLFSVLHYIRIDLGIEVEIDISRLQPALDGADAGMSSAHCAVGKIRYPALYRADGKVKVPAMTGWLVYFKPAITAGLPAEILQFWQLDKKMFPHPSTADQFFSERQFEAQRRLGEESVLLSLRALMKAYEDGNSPLKKTKEKTGLLKGILEDRRIDFILLARKPALLDEIIQDWMDALNPAA